MKPKPTQAETDKAKKLRADTISLAMRLLASAIHFMAKDRLSLEDAAYASNHAERAFRLIEDLKEELYKEENPQ
jgi:hypothetical protein